jgi:hypothetical protein
VFITDVKRIHLVLFGMNNGVSRPCFAAIKMIFISVMVFDAAFNEGFGNTNNPIQNPVGVYHEGPLRRMDYVLATLRATGIRAILTLTNWYAAAVHASLRQPNVLQHYQRVRSSSAHWNSCTKMWHQQCA